MKLKAGEIFLVAALCGGKRESMVNAGGLSIRKNPLLYVLAPLQGSYRQTFKKPDFKAPRRLLKLKESHGQ